MSSKQNKINILLMMMNDMMESDDMVFNNMMFMMKFKSTRLKHLRTLCSDIWEKHFHPSAEIEVWITKYSAYDFHVNYRMTQDKFYTLLRFSNQVSPDISNENYIGGNWKCSYLFKKKFFFLFGTLGRKVQCKLYVIILMLLNHQFLIF